MLITLSSPNTAGAEAFRTLRTSLYFAALEQPFRSIVVATPTATEHKSEAIANLAVVMAQGGQKVIIVDADFRTPMQHTLFGVSNATGLSQALATDGAHAELQQGPIDGLRILASGPAPAIASDLLNSKRMNALLARLSADADVVLIDAAPTAITSDAAILASKADAALIVIASGKTRREHAQATKDLLARAHARVLGAVLLESR